MGIPVLNTRATIEDFYEGKIDEIIFEEYGYTKDRQFYIMHPEKLAYQIGRDMCDYNDELDIDDVTKEAEYAVDEIKEEIMKFLYEYIMNNFEGKWKD